MEEAFSNDKLLVFGAANDGQIVSSLNLYMPLLFKGETAKNQLNVTAIFDNAHLKRNSDGSISGDYIDAPLTNLAKYCEDYTIAAPGWRILSSDANDNSSFVEKNGT